MNMKRFTKVIPLCVIASLTSCNAREVSTKLTYFNNEAELIMPSEYNGLVKYIKDIFNQFEKYKDKNVLNQELMAKKAKNDGTNNQYEFTSDYGLYELVKEAIYAHNDASNYSPFSDYLSGVWNEALDRKEKDPSSELQVPVSPEDTQDVFRAQTNARCGVLASGNIGIKYDAKHFIDVSNVIEGYILDQVYNYTRDKELSNLMVKASSSSMLVLNRDGHVRNITIDGPYGKPVTFTLSSDAFISVASIKDSATKIADNDLTYSRKYINYTDCAPYVKNDAIITVYYFRMGTNHTAGEDVAPGVQTCAYSASMMFDTIDKLQRYEEKRNVSCIAFKNGGIAHCSNKLEVKYDGLCYGLGEPIDYVS